MWRVNMPAALFLCYVSQTLAISLFILLQQEHF